MEEVGLRSLLLLVVNGGAGVLVYAWLQKAAWYQNIEAPDVKRWIAAGITAGLAVLAYLALVVLGFAELPQADWRSWLIQLANIFIGAFVAFGTSQLSHTRDLKARYLERQAANERAKAGRYRGR